MVIHRRPHRSAICAVTPDPHVGSSTRSPGSVAIRMQRSTTESAVWTAYLLRGGGLDPVPEVVDAPAWLLVLVHLPTEFGNSGQQRQACRVQPAGPFPRSTLSIGGLPGRAKRVLPIRRGRSVRLTTDRGRRAAPSCKMRAPSGRWRSGSDRWSSVSFRVVPSGQLDSSVGTHVLDGIGAGERLVELVVFDLRFVLRVPEQVVGDAGEGFGRRSARCGVGDGDYPVVGAEHFVEQDGDAMDVVVADLDEQAAGVG